MMSSRHHITKALLNKEPDQAHEQARAELKNRYKDNEAAEEAVFEEEQPASFDNEPSFDEEDELDYKPKFDGVEQYNCKTSVKSYDGAERISFGLLKHARDEWMKYKASNGENMAALREACDSGSYESLRTYIFTLRTQLADKNLPTAKRTELLAEFYEYTDRICQLYWSAGFLVASLELKQLEQTYREDLEDDEMGDKLDTESMICFVASMQLRKMPPSEVIFKAVSGVEIEGIDNYPLEVVYEECKRIFYKRKDRESFMKAAIAQITPLMEMNEDVKEYKRKGR